MKRLVLIYMKAVSEKFIKVSLRISLCCIKKGKAIPVTGHGGP
jgi:hypothetical protein